VLTYLREQRVVLEEVGDEGTQFSNITLDLGVELYLSHVIALRLTRHL
jgi:hypothetical protein